MSSIDPRYDTAPCGLLTTTPRGEILLVNRTLCTWLEWPAGELRGRRMQDLLTMGGRLFHQTHWAPLLQMQGSVAEVQLELVCRDGRTLPALINAVVRSEGDETFHDVAVFLATDRRKYERELVAEKKRAERLLDREREARDALHIAQTRLQLALDSARLVVWEIDPQTGAPVYGVGINRLVGLAGDGPMAASSFLRRVHPDDAAAERAAYEQAVAPGSSGTYAAEFRVLGHDGETRVVSSSGQAFFAPDGRFVSFTGVMQDVTSWRRGEELLRTQQREAKQRAELAEQLIGIVSHDLRTPLSVVTFGTSLLAEASLSVDDERTRRRIASAADRATRLIADLLDFTQLRLGGGIAIHKIEFDLHAHVSEAIEEMRVAWRGRRLEHVRRGEGSTSADPDRIAQIVTNLVTNALTYGSADQPVPIVTALFDDTATISVHNHGPTIPTKLLPHLFEPMRRGEHQMRLGSRSVGLGLYIVHEIAVAHGGEVEVESNVEEGTTFSVRWPRRA